MIFLMVPIKSIIIPTYAPNSKYCKQNKNEPIENDSQGDVYEIHVHTHVGAKEIAEETVVYNDEQLGKRNKRKERGNAG